MIVHLTRILLLAQLLIAGGLAMTAIKLWHVEQLWLAWLLGLGIVLGFRGAITANNFLIARRYRDRTESASLSWFQCAVLFIKEFYATMYITSWSLPFQTFTQRLCPASTALPVLLIHGYGCNSGYWHSMSKALQQAGISHAAVDLEPVLASIDAYSAQLQQAVDALCQSCGSERVVLVGHSMGGLAARVYLRARGAARVARVITLATPHYGTALANYGIGINSAQMRWSNDDGVGGANAWLRQLCRDESSATRAIVTSIYTPHDNIVSPHSSCHLPGALNVVMPRIGHVAFALHPAVQARVIEEVRLASHAMPDSAHKMA
jgi:triacylglycerol lipase